LFEIESIAILCFEIIDGRMYNLHKNRRSRERVCGRIYQRLKGGIRVSTSERYSVHDIANYFLSKSSRITPKKLQKLLYFSYSWYLALMNETKAEILNRLFSNKFEAWIHGPVCPELYKKYKTYGASYIPKYTGSLCVFTEDDKDVLENVWDEYARYTANELESISHQHDPWKITREKENCSHADWCSAIITDELIFDFYSKQLNNSTN